MTKKTFFVKVNYDPITGLVKGNYPNKIKYKSVPKPFIEIKETDQDKSGKQMCVIDGVYQEYIKSDGELLEEAKREAVHNRENYLISSFKEIMISYEPGNIPQEIKDKRILARTEIKQIKKEIDINNIVIDFS